MQKTQRILPEMDVCLVLQPCQDLRRTLGCVAWSGDTLIGARWTQGKLAVSTVEGKISALVWRSLRSMLAEGEEEVEAVVAAAALDVGQMQNTIAGRGDCGELVGSL
jgi:hypothetical protein